MIILDGIATLADRYDGFVLDLWGVVHNGRKPYPGVADALGRLQALGKRVAFLSNAPRRAHAVDALLDSMGLDRALWNGTMTSGELAWRHFSRGDYPAFGRHALHIGPARDLSVIEDTGLVMVEDPAEASFVLNTGPEPARGNGDVGPYRAMLAACAERQLPMMCVNPDRFVMVGEERVICAGALADLYRELGGPAAIEIGKPDPAAYPPVLELLGITDRARVLAIGDSPHTDLAGAQAAGLDCVWALTGLAAHAHGTAPDSAGLDAVAAAQRVSPIAALTALRW